MGARSCFSPAFSILSPSGILGRKNSGRRTSHCHPHLTDAGRVQAIDRLLLTVAVLILISIAPTYAQAPRHGAWAELGLGYGSARFSCDTCTGNQRLGGWTIPFGAGGTLSPHVRLGADVRVWVNGLKTGRRLPGIDVATLLLSYYPRARGGPFALGGGGLSHYEVCKGTGNPIDPCSRDPSYYSGWGWGVTLGAGWEIPNGRSAFRPVIAFHRGVIHTLHSASGASVTGWNQNLLTIELRVLVNLSEYLSQPSRVVQADCHRDR
jgi:hypothetical protein